MAITPPRPPYPPPRNRDSSTNRSPPKHERPRAPCSTVHQRRGPTPNPLTGKGKSFRIRGLHNPDTISLGVRKRCPDGRPQTKTFQFANRKATFTRCDQAAAISHVPAMQCQPADTCGLPEMRLLHGPHGRGYGKQLAVVLRWGELDQHGRPISALRRPTRHPLWTQVCREFGLP